MSATQEGVDRTEALQSIYGKHRTEVLTESGVDESALLKGGEEPKIEVKRPDGISEEDWGGMSDEARGIAWQSAQATGGKKEDAAEGETEEARKAREEQEAAAKAEEDRKAQEAAAAAAKTVRIKVDGVEQDVSEDKVREAGIRALQKESAADRRLEEATRLLTEAKGLKETLGDPSKDGPKPGADGKNADVDARAAAHAIQYGSEEEAAEALKKFARTDGNTKGMSPEEIAHLVDERSAFQAAVGFYRTEFPEIASNPDLHKLFLLKEREARQTDEHRRTPYRELYEIIGKGMRETFKGLGPKPDPLKDKRERKSAAAPHPTSASARTPAPTETKAPTPSDTVRNMRIARGQPV